jgi:hypothetical protein
MIEIQAEGEDGTVGPLSRDWHSLTPRRVDLTKPADPAALQRDARYAVVVACIDDEGDLQIERR